MTMERNVKPTEFDICQVWGCDNPGKEKIDGIWFCAKCSALRNDPNAPNLCMYGWPDAPEPLCRRPAQEEVITVFRNGYSCSGAIPETEERRVNWRLRYCPEHFAKWEGEAR
jgi:hypothetical protein